MRFHRRSILTLPLVVTLLAPTIASTGSSEGVHISGRVVQEGNGAPLAGAQVSVRGTSIGALTNRDGRYSFQVPSSQLRPGDLHVVAAMIGYRTAESVVHVADGVIDDTLTVDFRLHPEPVALETLVVTADAAQHPTRSLAAKIQGVTGQPRYPAYRTQGWNREQYAHITENAFRAVADHPLSTFSIDVDRASYSNVRRFLLREGRLPPVDAVQLEEMVNYFTYDYEHPQGDDPVAVTSEVGQAPWAPEHRLLRIGLASRPIPTGDLPPANLVFLLDVSGSMMSPDKLPLVKASMRLLVDQLRPIDRVAIVVYAGAAGLVLPPTSGGDKEAILEAIARLQAGGSTAGGAGLRLAYDVARRSFRDGGNNRVILATDGDFNVGQSSDGAMVRLIEEKRKQGTFLTVLGFGTGNLQSEKMQELAQHGNGNYAYIDGLQEARKVLVGEMGGTLVTVAKDVKVQIEFNPARVRAYRLLGYENRLLAAEDFNDDEKDAGDMGAGHTVTALYEIVPTGVHAGELTGSVDTLRYRAPGRMFNRSRGDELAFVKVRYKRPHGTESRLVRQPVLDASESVSGDFRFAAAVAGFGMLLRDSKYRGTISADRVLALAREGMGPDRGGYRHGFLDLVRAYRTLKRHDGQEQDGPDFR